MNTFPRDLAWVGEALKDAIARFRDIAASFRETGDMQPLLKAFDAELGGKYFTNDNDRAMVRGFFISLARSQRLVTAAMRGDLKGVVAALADGADPRSRNGQGRTALQAAVLNSRVGVAAEILRRTDPSVAAMRTMDNETCLEVAREAGARECQVLLRHKLGETFPPLLVPAIEGDAAGLRRLLFGEPAEEEERAATPAAGSAAPAAAPAARSGAAKGPAPVNAAAAKAGAAKAGSAAKAGAALLARAGAASPAGPPARGEPAAKAGAAKAGAAKAFIILCNIILFKYTL